MDLLRELLCYPFKISSAIVFSTAPAIENDCCSRKSLPKQLTLIARAACPLITKRIPLHQRTQDSFDDGSVPLRKYEVLICRSGNVLSLNADLHFRPIANA
ncbi:jg19294 [Pararge aegeria aegeria]|uniref:Jg19294 protein n=1 Tax=Pararge aegeria aegeria TaxID=348720 RepID=A0A8S4RQZ7_9NEOP|nr:jg19294 [Pararge aegeria aegeria]